jgi:hypothetical protein
MSKNIQFIASNKKSLEAFDPPIPAKKILPEWYKEQGKYTGPKINYGDNGNPNHTIKACMPVFDIMTAGYIVTMPADVNFTRNLENGGIDTVWSTDLIRCIESHPVSQYDKFSVPEGYDQTALKIIQPWIIKTPPGYSCMLIQPSYRSDLPFYVLPAIVDTDKHPLPINFPFFIKNNFEGIVEYGTPIMQIIPFKRENWKSSVSVDLRDEAEEIWQKARRKLGNRYKTFYRTIKNWD